MCDVVCTSEGKEHNNKLKLTTDNNNSVTKDTNSKQKQPLLTHSQQHLGNSSSSSSLSLKTSIYDWDSPSSSTGTVKRRPHSVAKFDNKTYETTKQNNNVSSKCHHSNSSGRTCHIRPQTIAGCRQITSRQKSLNNRESSCNISSLTKNLTNMQKSSSSSASRSNINKEKPQKLRLSKTADRNANSTSNSPTHNNIQQIETTTTTSTSQAHGGTIRKSTNKRSKYSSNESNLNGGIGGCTIYQDENYMEFEFFNREIPNREVPQFTELFRDFPVSYETTTLAIQSSTLPNKPPPYRDPPPPTPPPLSQLPSRNLRNTEASQSCPSTPFRGKVVLSKKERKELSKLNKLQDTATSNSTSNIRGFDISDAGTPHSSPYKGRVTELKNCIARINSKGLFASLHRSSQKSLNSQPPTNEEQTNSSNEISPPPPAPETSPPGSNASNNNDADYTEKLKNLPVRQRKAHTSHMDNYCLFDPMDFVNEKALRRRTHDSLNIEIPLPQQQQGLRDPLFSSRQNLDFSEEELVPEVIYDQDTQDVEPDKEENIRRRNFDHHNYFVIDPDDFEEEPVHDIGIPNPFTNEQLVQANLIANQHTYANNPEQFKTSESLEKLLNALEAAPSLTNSQESKDTTTQSTTTTSTALVESSTSTNSNTSSTSNTSSQTTLQRTKKKLTFLNLSPFRSQKSSESSKNEKGKSSTSKQQERAVSELVTSEHMFRLQRMLLSADNVLNDTRPINENIELNYVLFNPGPVPSRNVQYKIRKPRPLSTHSDADSGFLSPCSPDEFSAMKFNPALLVLQQCDSVQGYIEIYTDWANYYLERSKSKKKVTDLSSDCRDGLLLAEVIEAVTSFKVPDLHKKPKNQQQMYDNVNSCLNVLRSQTVSGLDNITTNDICCGRLKAVLALFFALSRFKQQSKQSKNTTAGLSIKADIHQQPNTTTTVVNSSGGGDKTNTTNSTSTIQNANVVVGNAQQQQQQQQESQSIQNGNDTMVNRQIPQAYTKANGTAIPLPATVMVQRRCPPDKVRPLPPTPNHTPSIPGLGRSGSEFNSSRPNSPPSSNHSVQSLKSGNNNGLRPPTVKSGIPAPGTNNPPTVNGQQKHSMLDKLKLFNKEKSSQQQQQTTLNNSNKNQIQSKRTSSSSGFSSARSERSDSSLSLNDGHMSQIKPPTVSVTSGNKSRADAKGKQSGLIKAQTKKDQVKNSTKLDKKEKSPARSLHKEEPGLDSRSSTLNRSKNSLTRGNDKAKSSSKTSLNNKSESKTSLVMPTAKALNSPNGTGLPKPIAAIKGTSKLQTPDNKSRMTNSNSSQDMKREKSDISSTQNISTQQQNHQQQPPTHIVKPVAILPEQQQQQQQQHRPPYYANTQPQQSMQHQLALQEPTYSRLPPPKTGLGTPSSVRKLEYNSGPQVLQPQQHSPLRSLTAPTTTHSQPVTPTTQQPNSMANVSPNKFHTIPSNMVSTIYEEEKPVNILPMRPLLRGYNSHVTLPTRGSRGGTHHFISDFCENDINQGYCSDGDSLRFSNARMGPNSPLQSSPRFHDIDNGYLSEGSSGIGLQQNGHTSHGKHFLSMMRARTQLPTTIEERIRNSRGSLDSIGTAAASSAASQASSSGGSNPKMDMTNGFNGSANNSANNSPQHHHSSPGHRSSSRNGRDNWSKMPEPLNGQKVEHKEKSSPSRRNISGSSSKQGSPSSSRTKGVPPSFGYVKRSNGCNTSTAEQQNIQMLMQVQVAGNSSPQNGRTAHVSAVPRTSASGSRKVQGGAQTLPHEVTKMPPNTQHRSYSLTGPGATQLSQCIRERLAGSHSLPKPGSDMHMFQHRLSNRSGKMLDGSLSDTQTYAEVKPEYSSYAMWLKHSNTAGSRLSDGDTIENMQMGSPSMSRHSHKMMQHRAAAAAAVAAANAAAANTNNITGSESPYVQSPRLNRSNSIRSTKSEKMYPSMLSRGPDVEIEPYYCLPVGAQHNGVISAQMAAAAAAAAANAQVSNHQQQNNTVAWSQPTSPTPINRGFTGPMSPTHGNTMTSMSGVTQGSTASHRLTYPKKNDEVHGSTASLLSGGSSLYGTSEERQAQEIRRLKRELMEAREQVLSLSGQLSTNNFKDRQAYGGNDSDYENGYDDGDSDDNLYLLRSSNKITIQQAQMSATTSTRPSPATTPLYDGYATIRGRGLTRSLSIRAKELEAAQEQENATEEVTIRQYVTTQPGERKRTISLRSDYGQTSPYRGSVIDKANNKMSQSLCQSSVQPAEDVYISRSSAKPVKTPTISDIEPLYASANTTFRPLSDASSSSGGANSGSGCRDSVVGSSASGSINVDYQSLKKNSRFSLDSLHSSNTAKTPDYTTADEDQIFLYTAPDSPKRRLDSGIRNSYDESSEREYSPINKHSFEMQEYPVIRTPSEHSHSSNSPAKTRRTSNSSVNYKRAQSLGEYSRRPLTLMTSSFQRSDSESPTYITRPPPSPSSKPPPTPVRRESLYAKPKIYSTPNKSPCHSPSLTPLNTQPKISFYQLPSPPQRSSSAEILERSYTSHSLATIDQDEILAVPSAMPVLQNPVDRRYHTLGHMRVQSLGNSLHRVPDSPMGSLVNMMSGSYYAAGTHNHHLYGNLHPNKSAGNIYASAEAAVEDLNKLAPEYMDPLDFKIGCQTTLRSKPIIPWYELAIKRDANKRQSCPPISSSLHMNGTQTLSAARSTENQAHVVAAFEQSLSNMTSRLQHLTATAERKDGELTDMRQTIELLRKQSIQAGLTTAHMQSMGVQTQSQSQNDLLSNKPPPLPPSMPGQHMSRAAQHHQQLQTGSNGTPGAMQRHHSSDSMCSVNSIGSSCSAQDKKQKKKGWLRSSFTKAFSRNAKISKTSRHVGHNHGPHSGAHPSDIGSHASGLNRSNGHGGEPPGLSALATQPAPTMPASPTKSSPAKTVTLIDNAKPIDAIDHDENTHVVEELKKQLREKDLVLTDIRLEALSSASQLESLKDTVNKMRAEMMSLKQNNERLQKMVTSRSLAGSEVSLGNAISPNGSIGESRRYSLADGNSRPPMELPKRLEEEVEEENIPPAPAPEPPPPPISPTTHIDLTPPPPALESMSSPAHIPSTAEELQDVSDGKKLAIACYLGQPESFGKYCEEMLEVDDFYANSSMIGSNLDENGERKAFPTASPNEFVIAYTYISGKTSWQNLDYIVRKTFKDYVSRIDPGTNLGLNTDSITSYHLGEAKRGPEMGFPELLPCGYIVGNVRTLYICLQGVGSLAFDSLIPRSIVHRYISLLTEHRRLILCGPSGTGKSYLARRLAEFLVARSGRGNPSEAIATFNVDHKSSKELRQYLGHIAEQAAIANGASELPSVIILDNLHHASALGDVFSCLLSAGPAAKLPCIIGTMSQATCNTTNLQLHHNFRWVLTANHMEPVKGFLGRFLRRRLFQLELQTQHAQSELASVLAWLPTVWQHINRFLEAHSSSDVTIGPRLFLACPLDLKESQVWFTDIWNYHLSPYLIEAVREGVQLYGRRGGAWNDPSAFIRNSYPWPYGPDSVPPLRQINAEDVGLEGVAASNSDNQDPLLNMLMRLQEAANYSENQDQESDCASLDSNVTPDSSAGAE